jgi:hypothetical protein
MKALLTLAAVLAALVVATPLALAGDKPQGATSITETNPTAPDIRQTDPRAAGPVPSYPFITDLLFPGGGTVVSTPAARGFDWADAGIGAAGTAGLILLLLGSARVMQQHRRRLVAA